jgi:hypothetical protein
VHESAYLCVGEPPVSELDWEIGTRDVLALPLYELRHRDADRLWHCRPLVQRAHA